MKFEKGKKHRVQSEGDEKKFKICLVKTDVKV